MEKEDVVGLLELASRSRVHSALVGILMMIIGIIFVSLGSRAIELEIVVGGILMIVLGSHAVITKGIRDIRGLSMIVLGLLFVLFTFVFESLHGLTLIMEFLSTGIISLLEAIGQRDAKYDRRLSLFEAVISLFIAVNLLIAHEESMDMLMTAMGVLLMILSIYVLWCAVKDRMVVNPFPDDGE